MAATGARARKAIVAGGLLLAGVGTAVASAQLPSATASRAASPSEQSDGTTTLSPLEQRPMTRVGDVLFPSDVPIWGDVIHTGEDASTPDGVVDTSTGQSLKVSGERILFVEHATNPQRPGESMFLGYGVLDRDTNRVVIVGGVAPPPSEPDGSELSPGFHALTGSDATHTLGWYDGPVTQFSTDVATDVVRSFTWSENPDVQILDVVGPQTPDLLQAGDGPNAESGTVGN